MTTPPHPTGSAWRWKYNFNPPQFSESLENVKVINGGKSWEEKGSSGSTPQDLIFTIKGWERFCLHKSDSFEIERFVKRGMVGGENAIFRRRYTFKPDRFISEKWLKYPGKKWFLDHRMNLKRLPVSG